MFRPRRICEQEPAAVVRLAIVMGLAALPVGLASCDSGARVEDQTVFTCPVPAPTACPTPPPRYADIAPIVNERCVPCHFGVPNGPWPLTDYMDLADWQDIIQASMLDCSMPPIDTGFRMRASERTAILTWVLCGFLP